MIIGSSLPSTFFTKAEGRPDGIANTSHQIRCDCGDSAPSGQAPATDHVLGSPRSRKHCREANGYFSGFFLCSSSLALSVTYRGTGCVLLSTSCASSLPVLGSTRFSLGSNTSVIWNGLM